MSSSRIFTALTMILFVGCTTSGRVGRETDAGPGAPADAGPVGEDAGACPQYCGTTDPVCCLGACEIGECLPVCDGFRCGDDCCGDGTVCVDGACEAPRGECIDGADCAAGEYCDLLLGRCLPEPASAERCEYRPPAELFEPELLWSYDEGGVMTIPLVVQLTDDDGDGSVTERDVPDVLVQSFPGEYSDISMIAGGRLVALSGDDGRVLWRSDPDWDVCVGAQAAAGDLDGDGTVEIVTPVVPSGGAGCHATISMGAAQLAAFSHLGALEWRSDRVVGVSGLGVALADVDGDGTGEIWADGALLDHRGVVEWEDAAGAGVFGGAIGFAANIDGDPELELLTGFGAWEPDGTRLWIEDTPEGHVRSSALADVDAAPGPELIAVSSEELRVVDPRTGLDRVPPIPIGMPAGVAFAGSPAVADYDGDGGPEIGLAAEDRYLVLDLEEPAPHVLWEIPSMDTQGGSVGTTVFDFDGDGSVEVLLTDNCQLRVLSGDDGRELFQTTNTSITVMEYALVADVNRDGHANVVVPSYAPPASVGGEAFGCGSRGIPFTGATRGLRVYRDALNNWIEARGVWNQHAYHFDNVTPDGALRARPRPSWEAHNTFRTNRYPNPETIFLAPNLRVAALHTNANACPSELVVRARVENAGSRSVAAGVPVTFYAERGSGGAEVLGTVRTPDMLAPGSAAWIELTVADVELEIDSTLRFFAVADDDGDGRGVANECDEEDNRAEPLFVDCSGPF